MRITIEALEADAREAMRERVRYNIDAEKAPRAKYAALQAFDGGDAAHEIADSTTPVYTSDLLALAADSIDLATDTPEIGPAFDGSPTPVNIIAANVYERLYTAAAEVADDVYNAQSDRDAAEIDDEPYMLAYEAAHEFYHTDPDSPARVLAEAFAAHRPDPAAAIVAALIEAGYAHTDDEALYRVTDHNADLLAAYEAGRTASDYTPPALAALLGVQ